MATKTFGDLLKPAQAKQKSNAQATQEDVKATIEALTNQRKNSKSTLEKLGKILDSSKLLRFISETFIYDSKTKSLLPRSPLMQETKDMQKRMQVFKETGRYPDETPESISRSIPMGFMMGGVSPVSHVGKVATQVAKTPKWTLGEIQEFSQIQHSKPLLAEFDRAINMNNPAKIKEIAQSIMNDPSYASFAESIKVILPMLGINL